MLLFFDKTRKSSYIYRINTWELFLNYCQRVVITRYWNMYINTCKRYDKIWSWVLESDDSRRNRDVKSFYWNEKHRVCASSKLYTNGAHLSFPPICIAKFHPLMDFDGRSGARKELAQKEWPIGEISVLRIGLLPVRRFFERANRM